MHLCVLCVNFDRRGDGRVMILICFRNELQNMLKWTQHRGTFSNRAGCYRKRVQFIPVNSPRLPLISLLYPSPVEPVEEEELSISRGLLQLPPSRRIRIAAW